MSFINAKSLLALIQFKLTIIRKWNYLIESSRVLVENAFSRMKLWKVLSTPFRGEKEQMHMISNVCAQLTNMDLESRPLRQQTPQELCDYYQAIALEAMCNQ